MPGLHTQHPDAEKLTAFGLGRLSEADSKAIELHVADCEECRKKLEDVPADSLVSLLQASASDTMAGPSGPSSDTDSSALSKESVPPLYKKLAQIIGGKPEEGKATAPAPKDAPVGAAMVKPGFTVPRELDGHARYLVLEPLGAGGMGTVYKAQHRLMERVVALKIVNQLLVTKPGAVERFTREVKAAAQLVHPNIVTAYDAEKVGEMHLLVMEFVEGRTLAQVLTEERELAVAKACDHIRQTAIGLQHALERGMVHRDIKPQNLMLTSKAEIKILDFGLARFVSEQAQSDGSTEHGSLMGSPDYMAPEQAQDAHSADARADIYGMGCTLYHLLAGQVPFPEPSLLAKLEAHRDKQPIALNLLRTDVSAELAKVVAKMMAKDPAQRYQTPGEVAAALAPFANSRSAPAVSPAQPRSPRRVPWMAAAVMLLLLGPLGYFFGPGVYRFATNQGVVIIETNDDDIEVEVKNKGQVITIIDKKTGHTATLQAGTYEIELVKGKEIFKLSTSDFALSRGGREVVRVRRELAVAPPPVKDPPEKKTQPEPKSSESNPIPEPTPLAEWRKGREFLTVAQKGPADYRTIQEALNAIKTGQYVKVLDKGPYRETLIHSRQIGNIALVSDVGTRIEVPRWHTWGPSPSDKKKNIYQGCLLVGPNGFRLAGFEFRLPPLPPDTDGGVAVDFAGTGDMIIESCQIRDHRDFNGLTLGLFGEGATKTGRFLVQDNLIDGKVQLNADGPTHVTVQRNWIRSSTSESMELPSHADTECTVQHNIIQGFNGICMRSRRPEKPGATAGRYLIANNVIDVEHCPFWALPLTAFLEKDRLDRQTLSRAVTIQNNILHSRSRSGLELLDDDLKAMTGVWKIGHNSFSAEPKRVGPTTFPVFAKQPTDLIVAGPFLSDDPKHADYLRIAADGKLAAGGVGGDLPKYIGPFPPGTAPKDGDWFTRLQEAAKRAAAPTPPLAFTWPKDLLSLPEFLKGREILTVAQDGKAMFPTIGAAFDKVKPGQVIKVLDKGPYRESIIRPAPDNVALVSEVGTRIEIPKWHLWGPDGAKKDKNIYQGFVLHSSRGFRLAGFDVICPEVPADTASAIAIELAVGGELMVESCRVLHTPRYDRDMTPQDFKGEDVLALRLGADDPGPLNRQVVRDNYLEGTVDFVRGNAGGVFMERNRVIAPRLNPGVRIVPAGAGEAIIRHNVIHAFQGVYIAPQDPKTVAKARFLIANNVLDVFNIPVWSWSADNLVIAPAVRIQNNIVHSHLKNGMVLPVKEGATIKGLWQLGHNCFRAKLPEPTEIPNNQFMFPLEATDLVRSPQFLADDRADATKYPRIAADGPLAKGGAGGDLPSYIGAFPPGPAPKDGDWFTRLLEAEKRSSAAPTVKDLLFQAQAALDQKKIDKAIGLYTDILRMEPANMDALVLRGVHLTHVGKAELGLEDLNAAMKVDPNSTWVRCNRSFAFWRMGKSKECIADCDFVLSRDKTGPNAGIAYTNRATAFQGMGRFDRALADCEQLIKLNPDEIGHILWRGQLHDRLGNTASAKADLDRVRKTRPEVKDLASNLTNIVPQPMPLAEWLQGREIITVSQDGKGHYKRIQDALDVLKPGQCIKVLDKGPYRERLDKNLPEDVGLISDVGTRIELPQFKKAGPDEDSKDKNAYSGSALNSSRGLRLAGLEFAVPALPADAGLTGGLVVWATGDVVVENCRFLHNPRFGVHPFGAKERPTYTNRAIFFHGPEKASPLTRVFVADNHVEGWVYFHFFPAQIILERNRIMNWADEGTAVFFNLQRAGEMVIRHNMIHAPRSIAFRVFNPPDEDRPLAKLLIANNLFDNLSYPIGFWRLIPAAKDTVPLSRDVRFHNNIVRTGPEFGAVTLLAAKDMAEATKHWKLGHNCFLAEPAKNDATIPLHAKDVVTRTPFLSFDSKHADYLRSAADGPLATGGVGGNLPSYIGPLPPGPAPKDGDWFTRLRPIK